MRYCESPFFYHRRKTREVVVGDPARGGVIIGGDHPVVKQSMLTCDTMDTAECVKQTLDLVAVGCQLVRITAPTVKDAANLQNIVAELRQRGCQVPIVADIHFKPEAAMEAVKWVEVVRVNPGNYADSKKFAIKEYTDEQYAAELKRIEEKFTPLVLECVRLETRLRIGTNHGSLSDRIMNRYGDTPLGMVESALEFARICRQHDFHNFKFSMKSSNPKVMIECYRLLVARLEAGRTGLELSDSPGRHRSGRRRGRPHQIRHRHRLAAVRRTGRHHPRFAHGGFAARNRGLHRFAGADSCFNRRRRRRSLKSKAEIRASSTSAPTEFPFDPFHFERRETPEIELADGVKCGGEQLIRVGRHPGRCGTKSRKIRPRMT